MRTWPTTTVTPEPIRTKAIVKDAQIEVTPKRSISSKRKVVPDVIIRTVYVPQEDS